MTKILVIGTGAIGGFYSAKLLQSGAEVSTICRSDYEVVKKDGFAIKSCLGDFHFRPKEVLRDAKEYQEKADFIIVATKVLPTLSVVDLIKSAVHKETSIVLIQNGIFIEDEIAKAFPNNHLISAIAFIDVVRSGAGIITHAGDGKLTIADFYNKNERKTKELAALWQKVDVPCEIVADIRETRWKKLLWNASFNPISVLAGGLNTKEILDNILLKKLVKNVMCEVAVLAKIDGYEISKELIDKIIEKTEERKNPAKTSMLIDFELKRPMEVEAILGNAIRFADKKDVKVSYLESLYALISEF